jgi:Lrp/AsnC family transcriptional regulator, leucine-responsive regulatory protein
MTIDETNRHILKALQADGSISNAELARQVGLAPATVLERVRKLEQNGVIRRYTAIVDAEKVGFPITAFVEVAMSDHSSQSIKEFSRSVAAIPEVLECHHTAGDKDFLLKVVTEDIRSYERFALDTLAAMPNIGHITTVFVLSTMKEDTPVPV